MQLAVLLVHDKKELLTNALIQATRTKRQLQAKGTQIGNATSGRTEMNNNYLASTKRIVKRSLKWSEHHPTIKKVCGTNQCHSASSTAYTRFLNSLPRDSHRP